MAVHSPGLGLNDFSSMESSLERLRAFLCSKTKSVAGFVVCCVEVVLIGGALLTAVVG